MKKILSSILAICLVFTFIGSNSIFANTDNNIVYVGNGYIQEIDTPNSHTKRWLVVDGDNTYDLFIDYNKNIMKIDDEIINIYVEEIELPLTRTTVDYSTARNFRYKIPWKGSVTLLAAAIAGCVGGINAAGMVATIASALTADAENIWVTFTQYNSKESYYSNYYDT